MFSILTGILGTFGSFLGLPALLGSVGKIAETVIGAMAPALKAAVEFVIWFLQALWDGFCDVVDSPRTIIFVATLAAGTWVYAHNPVKSVQLFSSQKKVVKLEAQIKTLEQSLKDCRVRSPSQKPKLGKGK